MENQKNDQLIVQLKCLKRKIKSYDEAKFLTRMRKMSVKSARNYNIDAGFWNTKVDMFIHSEIGLPPRNKLNPFYKKNLAQYQQKFNELEKNKYPYKKEVSQDEIDRMVEEAKIRLKAQKLKQQIALENLQNDETLPTMSLKKGEIVNTLIQYLKEKRVYNLTDAINLYYKEKKEDETNEFIKKEAQKRVQIAQRIAQDNQHMMDQMERISNQISDLESRIWNLEYTSGKTRSGVSSEISSLKSELNDLSFDIRSIDK